MWQYFDNRKTFNLSILSKAQSACQIQIDHAWPARRIRSLNLIDDSFSFTKPSFIATTKLFELFFPLTLNTRRS